MKPVVTYGDVEMFIVDLLDTYTELDAFTKGVGLPDGWDPNASPPIHLSVASDGEFLRMHPVANQSTVRVTAWGDTPTVTKRAAHTAQALLLAEPHIKSLTGVLPATDDETTAELAAFTVRVTARSTPL